MKNPRGGRREFNRDLVVQLLEDTYEVLTAVDGVEGIQVAEHEHPDLTSMDLSLPVIDGWEATRRIKANAALCDIPSPLVGPCYEGMRRGPCKADVMIISANRSTKTCCSPSSPSFWGRSSGCRWEDKP